MELVILIFAGLCLGSFVQALVWRLRKKKDFVRARSQCESCGRQLAVKDLVPLFSWLRLRGRCRYCKKPIGISAPAIEITMASVFGLSYVFWPQPLDASQWLLLAAWLVTSAGLAALAVYDWRHMLLPNRLLYPTFFVAFAGRLAYIAFFVPDKSHSLWLWFSSLVVASGIFFVIYFASREKAIGFGDVRLGLITGTVLADPALSLLMLFSASLLGTIIVLPALVTGRKKLAAKIPYGPFLIAATWLALLFGNELIDRYRYLFLT